MEALTQFRIVASTAEFPFMVCWISYAWSAGVCTPAFACHPRASAWQGFESAQVYLAFHASPSAGTPDQTCSQLSHPCSEYVGGKPCRFFDPPAVPGPMDEMEEEEMQELQTALEEDYEIGWAGTVLNTLHQALLSRQSWRGPGRETASV